MPNARLPPEIHLVKGTKGQNQGIKLPEQVKKRIPIAYWSANPNEFSKERFVKETADYLFDAYGIGTEQDQHTLWMLADQMANYITARAQQDKHPMVIKINDGKTLAPNPFIAIANEAMKNAIKIMGELGLTPRSRLTSAGVGEHSPVNKFLKGAKG